MKNNLKAVSVVFNHVSVSFGQSEPILNDCSIALRKGSLNYFIGPNGSGKTTIIKALVGFSKFTGSIEINGKINSQEVVASEVSYLSQYVQFSREFPITAGEILDLFKNSDASGEYTFDLLTKFRLQNKLDNKVSELSGGELQKLLIVSLLSAPKSVVILDEPLNNLDMDAVTMLFLELEKLMLKGHTVIVVIHDHNIISSYSGRIFDFKVGRIVEMSDISELHKHD